MVSRMHVKPELKIFRLPRAQVKRTPPNFQWDGVFENYARAFIARNFWRVRFLFGSEDDALQECAIIFWRCNNLYRGKVTEAKHFMALFKRALANDWNVFARRDARIREFQIVEDEESLEVRIMRAATVKGNDEIARVVNVLLHMPASILSLVFQGDDDEKVNRRLKTFSGISRSTLDVVKELRNLLN